jgi:hypothetical protein
VTPRRAIAALAVVAGGLVGLAAALAACSPSEADRARTADALAAGLRAEVSVTGSRLLATRAVADFGIDQPVRLVLVRIADELVLDVRIEASTEMLLQGPIVACLVGPDAAPDDAGLESPCWGEPDLGPLIEAQLPRDAEGRLRLAPGAPVVVRASLRRDDARCDYPPGPWHLELRVEPLVAGQASGPRSAPEAPFDVSFDRAEPLRVVMDRRYCGLATKVVQEQGEPVIAAE